MFENSNLTPISQVGEFGLIEHLTKNYTAKNPKVLKAIGDDAAVIDLSNDQVQLISQDLLVEGVHFDLAYTPIKHLGFKAIAVNVSDILAMNAEAKYVTIGLAMSNRFTLEAIEELYAGIYAACDSYNIDLVGGDISSAPKGLTISVSVFGEGAKKNITYRSGAKPQNIICVTGDLGAAYMGLNVLEREKRVYLENKDMQPDLHQFEYLVGRQLRPNARLDVIELLKKYDVIPTSMIDISDGLASEMKHICHASQCGAHLYEEKIPLDPKTYRTAVDFGLDPSTTALNGGEDYELLMTLQLEDFEKIKNLPDFTPIGYITDKVNEVELESKQGNIHKVISQGWEHYNQWKKLQEK